MKRTLILALLISSIIPRTFANESHLDTGILIRWSTSIGITNQLQYTTDLASGLWIDVGEPVIGDGSTSQVFDAIEDSPARFYRVIKLLGSQRQGAGIGNMILLDCSIEDYASSYSDDHFQKLIITTGGSCVINEISPEFITTGSVCLYDSKELRLEINNDLQYLYIRATLWNDDQKGNIEKISQGRRITDYSEVLFDFQNNKALTPLVDRNYYANPLLKLRGLYYTAPHHKSGANMGLVKEDKGTAFIRFSTASKDQIRVDSYKIPLESLSENIGDTIGLCFYGSSVSPEFQINSIGYNKGDQVYYGHDLPRSDFQEYTLK